MRFLLFCGLASLALGADWQAVGPFGGSVLSVAVDPHDASSVLAGTRSGQLFRSTDRGATWSRISFGRFLAGNVQAVAIDASAAGHYWVGVSGEDAFSNGLWESRDAGRSWTQSLTGLGVESIAVFPSAAPLVAVGTRRGLYRTQGGGSWSRLTPADHPELQDIVSLAFDPADANILYAGTPHLPWKTADGGKTWSPIHEGMIDDSDVFSLHVSAVNSSRVFASACSGIYRSQDGGERWAILDGIPRGSRRTHVILEDPRDPAFVYAGTTVGLFRSSDGGIHWTRLSTTQVNAIAFDVADSRTIYVATEHAGLQISHDQGATLLPASQGIHARNVSAVAHAGSSLYAGTSYEGAEGGVFRADGSAWERLAGSPALGSESIRALASNGPWSIAATASKLLQSMDGARTWTKVPGLAPAGILAIAIVKEEAWAGTRKGLFRKSGSTWKKIAPVGNHAVLAIRIAGERLLIRGEHAAWVSPDLGRTWRQLSETMLFDAAVSCRGDVLLASSAQLSISVNGAAPRAVEGIPAGTVSAVAFHPLDCRQAFAVQFGKLYRSRDGGAHWSAMEEAASLPSVAGLWVSEAAPDTLVAAVQGMGIFTKDLSAE